MAFTKLFNHHIFNDFSLMPCPIAQATHLVEMCDFAPFALRAPQALLFEYCSNTLGGGRYETAQKPMLSCPFAHPSIAYACNPL
jgi:hypothetical protein